MHECDRSNTSYVTCCYFFLMQKFWRSSENKKFGACSNFIYFATFEETSQSVEIYLNNLYLLQIRILHSRCLQAHEISFLWKLCCSMSKIACAYQNIQ